jgi:hypothetical protein
VYTGAPLYDVTRDPKLAEEDQLHFNPGAFTMAQPLSATVGNFGNVPNGILRQPSFWNWDVTLSRRFPVPPMGRDAQVRVYSVDWERIVQGNAQATPAPSPAS